MTDEDPRPRPAPGITEAGVPAIDEIPEEVIRTGDTMEGEIPPLDHPQGAEEYGTTSLEQQNPETLEDRLAREEPDVAASPDLGAPVVAGPDTSGTMLDPDTDLVADDEALLDDTLAPEEAALRLTEDLPGATTDASPGYLEED